MAEDDPDEPGGGLWWGSLLSTPTEWHYFVTGAACGYVARDLLALIF